MIRLVVECVDTVRHELTHEVTRAQPLVVAAGLVPLKKSRIPGLFRVLHFLVGWP